MEEDYLLQIQKPARYIGAEWNVSKKDFDTACVKVALCFPDLYEVGMSNLGVRILYGVLNAQEGVVCERFFSYAVDMEALARSLGLGLVSLESRRRLNEFDIAGFSLSHELSYTNVLAMLELGGVPLRSSQRDHAHPLVIAGGPCTLNPEPMHDFFDAFVIGEAEEAVQEITALYQKHRLAYKQGALSKEDLLIMLTQIEGIYVPSLYDVSYTDSGAVKSFVARRPGIPHSINKRIVADLDKAFYPTAWLVPYLQTVHDRVALEIMRGCPNRCRFCQARVQYFPFRQRKIETVLQLAQKAYEASGYEEISLLGLSVSDYPCVESLVEQMVRLFVKKGVSVSLPSIRPMVKVAQVSSILARIKKTGLTFAPEAATDELRRTLGKNFDNSHFFAMLPQLFDAGYQRIKLYFMIGLPQERLEDLDAMVDFAFKVSQMRKRPGRGPAEVAMSVNTLIPKPHTPFQWLGLDQISLLQQKQAYLRDKIKRSRCLTLSFHNLEMSIIEAVLSRGDRRLSAVIEQAFRSEARFDAWEDHFSFSTWQEAFHHCGISYNTYLDARQRDEILPWDFINMGVSRSNLASEAP